jgi:hypothetical protein
MRKLAPTRNIMSSPLEPQLRRITLARLDVLMHGLALLFCLGLLALNLDRRELDIAESREASLLLSLYEPGPHVEGVVQPTHRVLAYGALLFGTTERALRVLCSASLAVAILITASVVGSLAGPRARAWALCCTAAASLVCTSARLDPVLLGLPAVAALSFLLISQRSLFRDCCVLVAALLVPWLAPCFVLPTLAAFFLLGMGLAGRPPRRVFSAVGAAALAFPYFLGATLSFPPHADVGGSGSGALALIAPLTDPLGWAATFAVLIFVVQGLWDVALLKSHALPIAFGCLCVACVALVPGSMTLTSARWGLLLPLLMLLVGVQCGQMAEPTQRWLAAGGIAFVVLFALTRSTADESLTARALLHDARALGAPGGRLLLAGPERFVWQYYTRRGHAPAMPVLLIPEDVREVDLAPRLRDALGTNAGAAGAPPVLLLGRPAHDLPELTRTACGQGQLFRLSAH